MPIIFGWGKQTIKQIGIVFKNICANCHNEEYWILSRIITWFSLFFIPIIPYSFKYFLSCPVCKYGLDLNQKQIDELKPIAEANQLLMDGQITQAEHSLRLNNISQESVQVEAARKEVFEEEKEEEGFKYCMQCGSGITNDIKFCGNCGNKISKEFLKK